MVTDIYTQIASHYLAPHTHHMKYSKRINRLLLLCHFGYFFQSSFFGINRLSIRLFTFVMTIYENLINKQQSNKPPEIHSWFLTVFLLFFSVFFCTFSWFLELPFRSIHFNSLSSLFFCSFWLHLVLIVSLLLVQIQKKKTFGLFWCPKSNSRPTLYTLIVHLFSNRCRLFCMCHRNELNMIYRCCMCLGLWIRKCVERVWPIEISFHSMPFDFEILL